MHHHHLRSIVIGYSRSSSRLILLKSQTPPLSARRCFSQEAIGKRYEKPWDYKKKRYGILGQLTDSTMRKLGENSLIISVEGNFGAGKSAFAKELANKIDFVYAREPDLEEHMHKMGSFSKRDIINEYVKGNERYHVDSLDEWHSQPSFKKTIAVQHKYYIIRWMQMRTALLHLMSTGQGVVLERSVFSDSVIGQSLYENNLMSDEAYRFYMRDLIPNTIGELWRPHACIYLDMKPEECLQRIRQNGKSFEKESKVYTLDLLRSVDKNYKRLFLPEVRNHMHLLTLNGPSEASTEKVIEDLEMLDFEDETKFHDWRVKRETTINLYRKVLSNHQHCYSLVTAPSGFIDVPEYLKYGEDYVTLQQKLNEDTRYNEQHLDTSFTLFGPMGKGTGERNWL